MSIVAFSTLIPSSPGYIGTFHYAAFSAILLIADDTTQAGVFAIILHATVWIVTTISGGLAIMTNLRLFNLKRLLNHEK